MHAARGPGGPRATSDLAQPSTLSSGGPTLTVQPSHPGYNSSTSPLPAANLSLHKAALAGLAQLAGPSADADAILTQILELPAFSEDVDSTSLLQFLAAVLQLPAEQTLAQQNFACQDCAAPLPLQGTAACAFDGRLYCTACLDSQLFPVPARLVGNGDLAPKHVRPPFFCLVDFLSPFRVSSLIFGSGRQFSQRAARIMRRICTVPLLDLQAAMPYFLEHVPALRAAE